MKFQRSMLLASLLCLPSVTLVAPASAQQGGASHPIQHVLLISVDGMHALDLANFAQSNPNSTLAQLGKAAVTYTGASTSRPSDSFPGLMAQITGGSPNSTGVWYDVSYDHSLLPPGSKAGATPGTVVAYDESADKNQAALDGGGGVDPAKLPLDPKNGNAPVYPHSYLRVNTIFEVIKAAGGRTAWSDKHPAYEIANGPSGKGLDDLYAPEINNANDPTGSVSLTEAYDDLKVQAILNEIDGKDHAGAQQVGVPAIFGMNFQEVSVGEKLAGAGYTDGSGTPSTMLLDALTHTDASLGKMVAELQKQNLLSSTLIIVSAKHGQSPIDPTLRQIIDDGSFADLINRQSAQAANPLLAGITADDIALLFLSDASKTADVVQALETNKDSLGIQKILSGQSLQLQFNDPATDPRVPNIVVIPRPGVIYAGKTATKIAEHGGFSDDDTHVLLLVASPHLEPGVLKTPVQTTQIAPTILSVLGLDPQALQAVQMEKTQVLPGLVVDR